METKKITLRVPMTEYDIMKRRARESNLSLNQYLIRCGCGTGAGNEKQLAILMGCLGNLLNITQRAKDLPQFKRDVLQWRDSTITTLERMV